MKIGHIATLVLFGLASAWGGYTIYNRITTVSAAQVGPQRQIVGVSRGALAAAVNASGSIVMTRQAKLAFGTAGTSSSATAGTLKQLNVKLGDVVKQGQVLALLDTKSLERSVTQAKLNLSTAQLNLEKAKKPYTESDIAQAEAAVRNARVALENAQRDLVIELDIEQAEATVRNAQVALENAQRDLTITQNSSTVSRDARIAEDERNYYQTIHGDKLKLYGEGRASKSDLDAAWTNLVTAEEKLRTAKEAAAKALATAQNNVAKAQDALSSAENDLATKKAWLEKKLTAANETAAAKALATAQNNVDKAQDNLAKAENDLATKKAGGDPLDIQLKENQVANVQAALDIVMDQLESATIVAPFDGLVADVPFNVGETVAGNATVVLLVDTSKVRIDASLDEIDVAKVSVGHPVTVTFDALPNVSLRGKVTAIAVSGKAQSGVVSYPTSIELDSIGNTNLRGGMSALASITVERRDNVLMVPNRAIRTVGRNKVVDVMVNGEPQQRTVRTGLSNDQSTEITSGLNEGEQVAIGATTQSTRLPQGVPGGMMGIPGLGR